MCAVGMTNVCGRDDKRRMMSACGLDDRQIGRDDEYVRPQRKQPCHPERSRRGSLTWHQTQTTDQKKWPQLISSCGHRVALTLSLKQDKFLFNFSSLLTLTYLVFPVKFNS